jgi:hypothetical protein
MKLIPATAAAAAALLAFPAAAQPAAIVSTGVEYQEGDYGTGERIETFTVDNRVRVESDRLFLYASVPWRRIAAPANVVGGGGLLGLPIIIDPTRPGARDVREGLGDLRFGGGYRLPRLAGFELALTGELKLPTASASRGIGTGETDVAAGAEASRTFGAITPFVGISYTIPGDPDGYELRDSFAARGGLLARLAPGLHGTLTYGYSQSLSPLLVDEQQVSTALDVALSGRMSLGLHGSAGLSAGAADFGAGVRLGWRIF